MPLTVLLTGFEPFGGASHNPSGDAAAALHGRLLPVAGHGGSRNARVVGVRLPVEWDGSAAALENQVRRLRPHIVVSLGEGTEAFRVEQFADERRIDLPDNRGRAPSIHAAGTRLPTRLPLVRVEQAIAAIAPLVRSSDAGGYICNQLFFRLISLTRRPDLASRLLRAGFIHVPNHNVVPSSISSAIVVRAVEAAITVTVQDLTPAEYQLTIP
jgi:pyroglutamyl-peptidase